MKILHTADWHVGKTVRGRARADEHRAVLDEIVTIAQSHAVDLVVVAGDLFDTASPTPEAEQIVYQALLGLRSTGAHVVVIAGNHDNPNRLRAVAPLFGEIAVRVVAHPTRPDEGGVVDVVARDGTTARVALLPFVSQRGIVRADDLMSGSGAEHALAYADRYKRLLDAITAGFVADHVNLVVAHAFVGGGVLGGGERSAHTVFDYFVPATAFPPSVHYVALGHLHRAQQLPGPVPLHYCGSPLAMDFSEERDVKVVNVIDVEPGRPAAVESVPLRSGRRLRTLRATLDELAERAAEVGPHDYVRVVVRGAARAGLADEVRELIPGVVEVVVESPERAATVAERQRRAGRSPHELFAEFCAARGHDDPRVRALFAELLEECSASAAH
ncbi:MAG TPA: exonuclease SbcCD subunit D [Acidimicrobiales bacterium]